jgi:hypothetical protein
MRILTGGILALVLAGCTTTPQPTAGVQGTLQPDCDAAVKPTASVGVTIGSNGIRQSAGWGLHNDRVNLGTTKAPAADCAKAGLTPGATATGGVSVGG